MFEISAGIRPNSRLLFARYNANRCRPMPDIREALTKSLRDLGMRDCEAGIGFRALGPKGAIQVDIYRDIPSPHIVDTTTANGNAHNAAILIGVNDADIVASITLSRKFIRPIGPALQNRFFISGPRWKGIQFPRTLQVTGFYDEIPPTVSLIMILLHPRQSLIARALDRLHYRELQRIIRN
ncbi:MAG: hypothetical protein WC527_05390 [Candidatus Margulisiibacteriota bacterium]